MAESKAAKYSKRLSNPELRCKNGLVSIFRSNLSMYRCFIGVDFTEMLFTWVTVLNATKS